MNIHDVTELIWHFVGHLRLDEDVSRNRIQYEDAEAGRVLADGVDRVKDAPVRPEDPDDTDPTPVKFESFAGPPAIQAFVPHFAQPDLSPVPISPVDDIHFKIPPRVVPSITAGSGGHAYPESIGPEYRETLLDARQINQLTDSDHFADDPYWSGALPDVKPTFSVDELYAAAQDAIPAGLETLSGGSSQEAVTFASSLGSGGHEMPSSQVEPGSYHNGERLADDQTLPTELGAIVPEMPEPTNGPTGDLGITTQAAELGANGAYNYALIADANGACGTLVALGDKFSLNAIVQINAYSDDDVINNAGITAGEVLGHISGGGNHADNLAQVGFTELEQMLPAAKSGTQYRIDVVEGDFFDIRALSQTNAALDDDVATLTSSEHYCLVRTGANELVNVADLRDFDFSNYYDVIMVGGQYYDINAIVQLNLLRDNDAVSAAGAGNGATIDTGGNSLLNDAEIQNYGTTNIQPLGHGMDKFIASLADGDAADGASTWGFSDGGDGYIDVLYVTGDYFDINLLWQTNVVSDVDVAVFEAGGSSSETGTTQVASTGANELQNQAIIVDVDALYGEYIGGDVYEGSILIQANLIESDDDTVAHNDTDTLVPELIAFTDGPEAAPSDPSYVGVPTTMTDHIMSGMLS